MKAHDRSTGRTYTTTADRDTVSPFMFGLALLAVCAVGLTLPIAVQVFGV